VILSGSYVGALEITPKFGDAPEIDGSIDSYSNEWDQAELYNATLKKNPTDAGLPIELKATQDKNNLYLLVQFQIEPDSVGNKNFLAILIGNSTAEVKEDFIDAKMINISNSHVSYNDLHLNNSIYLNDTIINGEGVGKITNQEDYKLFTFEYCFSLYSSDNQAEDTDIPLIYGSSYLFNISHGNDPLLPAGIIRSTNITINILELPKQPPALNIDIINLTLTIIIFSVVGIFYIYYLYQIVLLKKKMERIRL